MRHNASSSIRDDEQLIFFPTIGHQDAGSGDWHLPIHGWIFRPEVDSLRRAAAVNLLRSWLGLEPGGIEAELFGERLWAFLVDNRPRKRIIIRLGQGTYELARSSANGHVVDTVRIPAAEISATLARQPLAPGEAGAERWLPLEAILAADDKRQFAGRVHLVGEQGVSVISDIDDTIKITHVHDRAALLKQTFLRDFESVPRMAELYRDWHAHGATFHYVSRSPWQLYEPLAAFVRDHNFPAGTFHMRNFRWKNASTLKPDRTGSKKYTIIEGILSALPRRQFICVGDSGEHDPEIYGQLAREFPMQIRSVYIRNVSGEHRDSPRMQQALSGIAADRWHLFQHPEELESSGL